MKHSLCLLLLLIRLTHGHAQTLHNTIFNAVPLTLNPAYTGMIDGNMRANVLYRSSMRNQGMPYFSYTASADAPVFTMKNRDYLGAGMQLSKDVAGDGNIKNHGALLSVAYHKHFGSDSAWLKDRGCELAVGIQAGYTQSSISLSGIYFDRWLNVPMGIMTYTHYQLGASNYVTYYNFNAGVAFSMSLSQRIKYVVGVSANNINQSNDAWLSAKIKTVGLNPRYTATTGADIEVGERLVLRPAAIVITDQVFTSFLAGNEFLYRIKSNRNNMSVFCGLWYRASDVLMVTAGINAGSFRVSTSFENNVSKVAASPDTGFEIAVGFITAGSDNKRRHVPCTRF